MITQFFVSFIATIAFSVLFNIPKEHYIYCGLTGSLGWLCYLIFFNIYPSIVVATFTGTIALTFVSRTFAVHRKTPATIFLISGIFPLVPGAGIYYTAYNIIIGENILALSKGIETIKIAVAIALGILIVFSLPPSFFKIFSFKIDNKRP